MGQAPPMEAMCGQRHIRKEDVRWTIKERKKDINILLIPPLAS